MSQEIRATRAQNLNSNAYDDLGPTAGKRGQTICGMPRWLFFTTCGILLVLGAAAAITFPVLKNTIWKNGGQNDSGDGDSNGKGGGGGDGSKILSKWLDKDTPESARTKVMDDGTEYKLVFSDEFNKDGRNFAPGQDNIWEAVDLHYWQTGDYEYYTPEQATTKGGSLRITLEKKKHGEQDYVSAMLQTWNNFCFRGGYLEANISLPGSPSVSAFWPAVWTMGNLGRAGYGASTEGLWPYSYDSCDVGVQPNQSDTTGLSWLPGQRLNKCLCKGQDTPTPGIGRSAAEIDLIEGAGSASEGGTVSQSHQFAPFDTRYLVKEEFVTVTNASTTFKNSYKGAHFQQAVSVLTRVPEQYYEGKGFQKYSFKYSPGPQGNVTWYVNENKKWTLDARAVGPNPSAGIGQRLISEEPMYLVINLGMSDGFGKVDFSSATFPGTLHVDYLRIYQHPDKIDVTCDPKDRPTQQYIKDHPKVYNDPSLHFWRDAGYSWPQFQVPAQCPS